VVTAEHKKPKKLLKHLGKIQKAQGEGASVAQAKVLIFCNKQKTVDLLQLHMDCTLAATCHARSAPAADLLASRSQVLIFCNKKKTVAFVGGLLSRHGYQCAQLQGDLSQVMMQSTYGSSLLCIPQVNRCRSPCRGQPLAGRARACA